MISEKLNAVGLEWRVRVQSAANQYVIHFGEVCKIGCWFVDQTRNQRRGNRAIALPKFLQTYIFVRRSNKLHHFAPLPEISVGCGPVVVSH